RAGERSAPPSAERGGGHGSLRVSRRAPVSVVAPQVVGVREDEGDREQRQGGKPGDVEADREREGGAEGERHEDPGQADSEAEAIGGSEEEREEEDIGEPELRRAVLARQRKRDRERVEDLWLVLDDFLRRAAGDREDVDRDDEDGDEQHPAERLEEGEEPPGDRDDRRDLHEVRGDVEAGQLEQNAQR